jgi:Tol biopolymer transport system component
VRARTTWRATWLAVSVALVACQAAAPSPSPTVSASAAIAPTIEPSSSPAAPTSHGNGLPSHGRIAFNVEFGPNGDNFKDLYTIEPDGSGLMVLTHVTDSIVGEPAWSPDGDVIVYLDARGATSYISTMAADGGSVRRLTPPLVDARGPAVSPDGTLIAFTNDAADGRSVVFLMRADGSDLRSITKLPSGVEGDEWPAFSPDGQLLAFNRDGAMYVVHLDGSGLRRIAPEVDDAHRPRWSPDGKRLLFGQREGPAIRVVNLDGSGLTTIAQGSEPDWSPDGRFIVFNRWRPGTEYIALVVAHADGSDPIEIWNTPPHTNNFIAGAAWGTAP